MNNNEKNGCRMCKKIFCCEECRKKHERIFHKIHPDCNICLYGRTFLENFTDDLLEHIILNHWPLHCVLCKKLFNTVEEMMVHKKCPVGIQVENRFESPPSQITTNKLQVGLSTLATSTPNQRNEDNILDQMHEIITPVDYSDVQKSTINETDAKQLKRKVSFCETPMTEANKKQKILLTSKNVQDNESSKLMCTYSDAEMFYSAKEENNSIRNENNTNWKSAINSSFEGSNKENISSFKHENTPMASKRKVNVVTPISVIVPRKYDTPPPSVILEEQEEKVITDNVQSSTLWTTMSQIVKNVMGFSENDNNSISSSKRSYSNITDVFDERPYLKRYKLTDIRCRKTYRDYFPSFASSNSSNGRSLGKVLVDKATQTEDIVI